jgi:hypothetical protein
MSTQHTQGRLEAIGDVILFPPQNGAFRGFNLEGCPNPEANARRLVACWNACEGVPTEMLEEYPAPFTELHAQRDELLEALELAMPALEAMRKQWPRSPHDDSLDVVEVAIAAIAKVKGGAA